MTWLLPELDDGEEPELRPPEVELDPLELELELDPVEPELELDPVEPEEVEPEEVEPEDVDPEDVDPLELEPVELDPELVEGEPVEVDALACVDPGRTRATTPAAATLAMVTAVVAVLTLLRPRSLAAMARRIPSRSVLLM